MAIPFKVQNGYPKLKKIIYEQNLTSEITDLINTSETRLNSVLNGEENMDFTHKEAVLICDYLNILPDDYFF